jgi:hypothetical protein
VIGGWSRGSPHGGRRGALLDPELAREFAWQFWV